MNIKWFGHASFGITGSDGICIITDPYESGSFDNALKYPPIKDKADIVTVSHQHADHNAVDSIDGKPEVIDKTGSQTVKDIEFVGIPTFHDTDEGAERGENIIFVFTLDGIKMAHLGDLGHIPDDEILKTLRSVDILFIPVGGHFTIGPEEAKDIVEQIKPGIVIPMHYKTEKCDFPIQPISEFTKRMTYNIKDIHSSEFEVSIENLPDETQILILNYVK
jgi:L-ascorbate metabolism protein UlaG (beta-lactamase superfamily)